MILIQQAFKEKLILKLKGHNFNPTNASYISTSSKQTAPIFLFLGKHEPKP